MLGYVGILQEALKEGDFQRLFHISGLINPPDCLTKVKESAELAKWYETGLVRTEPGMYGARAEPRKLAAAELRAEIGRRRKLGVPIPEGARQLQDLKTAQLQAVAAVLQPMSLPQ